MFDFDYAEQNGFSHINATDTDMPEPDAVEAAFVGIANELADLMLGTGLETAFAEISTRFTSSLHTLGKSYERKRDDATAELKDLIGQQDGSEIQSHKLEDLQAQVHKMDEIIDSIELMRDTMAKAHQQNTGSAWRPHSGSKTNRRAATSAIIDAREYLAKKDEAEALRKVPEGVRVAVVGTQNFDDHAKAFDILNRAKAANPKMVLITSGQNKGIDKIATSWAANNEVPVIEQKPDFQSHGKKAAPFKRNDAVMKLKPAAVLCFLKEGDRNGVAMNLVQKAEEAGVTAKRFGQRTA